MYGCHILQGMILSYKVTHHQDLLKELEKGKQVALIALKTKSFSSKDIKHIISLRYQGILQSPVDRDAGERRPARPMSIVA